MECWIPFEEEEEEMLRSLRTFETDCFERKGKSVPGMELDWRAK